MISFRVSESEFERLKSKSESQGAGSVSDYARLSLCGELSSVPDHLISRIHQLDGNLQDIRLHLERLTAAVENTGSKVVQSGAIRQQDEDLLNVDEDASGLFDGSGGIRPANQDAGRPAVDVEN